MSSVCPSLVLVILEQASNDLVEIEKRNMGEPNRIEGCMELVETNLEVSNVAYSAYRETNNSAGSRRNDNITRENTLGGSGLGITRMWGRTP